MLLPTVYEDAGISGGTLERPGLQRLLDDIDAGLVEQIVVYKVDRLTRSLSDFAKLVERLEAAGAVFVSVTQSFNTATSMGRLTLHMLLSFAQFEREVTAYPSEEDGTKLASWLKPEVSQRWRSERIPDDPVVVSNRRGRVAFAMGYEPNDRTTQIFISLKDKAELDDTRFAPIGEVVEGMAVADAIFSGYGESAGGGIRGGKQDPMFEGGNAHLDENFPELDRIVEARMIERR